MEEKYTNYKCFFNLNVIVFKSYLLCLNWWHNNRDLITIVSFDYFEQKPGIYSGFF